jgi:uncharacterized repeat protein (TIGR01451 family)
MNNVRLSTAIALALGVLSVSPVALANPVCLGNDAEQPPLSDVTPPTASLVESPDEIEEGQAFSLTAQAVVDTAKGGIPHYYWCAENGRFEADSVDYQTVKFIAPAVPEGGATVRVGVQVGDGLGYVGYKVATIKVLDTGNTDPNNPAPVASIQSGQAPKAGKPYVISFQVSDQDAQGLDSSESLNTDLYYSVGEGEFVEIVKGLQGKRDKYLWIPEVDLTDYRLKIVTTDGNQKTEAVFAANGEAEVDNPNAIYSASGKMLDKLGNPIPGVTVQVGNKTTLTDSTGYWEIQGLTEDRYTLTAQKAGYAFESQDFAVGNNVQMTTLKVKAASLLKVKVVPNTWKPVKQGENVTYTATVNNQGAQTATGVFLNETLPEKSQLVSLEARDGGSCDSSTLSCSLPDLTPGATATVQIVISNTQSTRLVNTVEVTANEYPTDIAVTWKEVLPYLSVSVSDQPDPVTMGGVLHYTAAVDLNHYAPNGATGIELVMQLPHGVELKSIDTDYGICDLSKMPTITCELSDLSIDKPDDISHIEVALDVILKDIGLLLLTHEAKVTANEYPAHTDRERTKIAIPNELDVNIAFVIDVTGSMQEEINGVIKALTTFIGEIETSTAPLIALVTFRDDVQIKALTRDMDVLLGAVKKLKASGGGTCPEASVEALLIAIPHLKAGSEILFATDASPYTDADIEKVLELLRSKGIRLNAMITGDCSQQSDSNTL